MRSGLCEEVEEAADVVGEEEGHNHDARPAMHGVQVSIQLFIVILQYE